MPAGTTTLMSRWVMQRDPCYHENPEWFDPDRWTAEYTKALPRFAYFPFGGGPRQCIGAGFAMVEAYLLLAHVGSTVQDGSRSWPEGRALRLDHAQTEGGNTHEPGGSLAGRLTYTPILRGFQFSKVRVAYPNPSRFDATIRSRKMLLALSASADSPPLDVARLAARAATSSRSLLRTHAHGSRMRNC